MKHIADMTSASLRACVADSLDGVAKPDLTSWDVVVCSVGTNARSLVILIIVSFFHNPWKGALASNSDCFMHSVWSRDRQCFLKT